MVAQSGSGVSVLGDVQNPTKQGPEQPALVGPALRRGVGPGGLLC